jgi:hypothetical protein
MLKHSALWGRLSNLRPIGKSACRDKATGALTAALCGADNPGCSRLSAGFLRLAIGRFLPQETLPSVVCRSCERFSMPTNQCVPMRGDAARTSAIA